MSMRNAQCTMHNAATSRPADRGEGAAALRRNHDGEWPGEAGRGLYALPQEVIQVIERHAIG